MRMQLCRCSREDRFQYLPYLSLPRWAPGNRPETRMVPKMTPSKTTVLVQKEEFRQLVDAAQVKCSECTDDSEQCKACGLFKLLKIVVPLESYEGTFLCPYNLAGWEN